MKEKRRKRKDEKDRARGVRCLERERKAQIVREPVEVGWWHKEVLH
jgi:hypothetical protein